uniref:Kinesin-like protein n=1 Tax=Bombyx mori TaxID=7091 RepID=A1E128_BOMMO|nr:kinesin-like protein 7 [Bombyx mori]
MSDNIKVVVKVRPLITREIEEKLPYQWRIKNNSLYQLDQNGKEFGSSFTFDKVYDESTKTSEVYNDIAKPIVEAAVAGFNGTIFAYGQTSSGKTYTMAGTESSPGIITLAVLNLFEIIKNIPDRDFLVRVSYIEIYNETVKDLLNIEKDNIKIHDTLQGIKVDATEKVTSSPEEVLEIIKQGEANRQTGSTNMNEKSSRSHSIFQITIESKEHVEGKEEVGSVNVSQLNLVDLAGSERAGQTGAKGLRFKEGTHINKSLSALALVIKKLAENPWQFNNYRDSKLTRILQNSLGGNAKTSIICAVTPAALEETISTLQFGNRAKFIKNEPILNEVQSNATMIQQLTKKLGALQTELECKKHLEQGNYNLQKQIAGLQRLILSGVTRHSTEDIISTRRKHPQRRITISALHSVEESTTSIPRFCTPVLKYNPMTLGGCSSDLAPLQRPGTLSTVPEETSRMVTPPPGDKRVNFEDEIIELGMYY